VPLGSLNGSCPLLPELGVVLLGILKGMDPIGPEVVLDPTGAGVVLVNLYGTCPEVPLGVMMVGVKPGGEGGSGVGVC